jgi:hypothetical protein
MEKDLFIKVFKEWVDTELDLTTFGDSRQWQIVLCKKKKKKFWL